MPRKRVLLILGVFVASLAYVLKVTRSQNHPESNRPIYSIHHINIAGGDQVVYRPHLGEIVYIKPNGDEFLLAEMVPGRIHPISFHLRMKALIEPYGFEVNTNGQKDGHIFTEVIERAVTDIAVA